MHRLLPKVSGFLILAAAAATAGAAEDAAMVSASVFASAPRFPKGKRTADRTGRAAWGQWTPWPGEYLRGPDGIVRGAANSGEVLDD